MSVRKRGGSWWVDFSFRGRRYRYRSPSASRGDAAEYENQLRARLASGRDLYPARDPRSAEPTLVRFGEFAVEWLATYAEPRLKPSTYADYVRRYEQHLKGTVGRLHLDAINGLVVERLVSTLVRRGLHPKSVNNILGVFAGC